MKIFSGGLIFSEKRVLFTVFVINIVSYMILILFLLFL